MVPCERADLISEIGAVRAADRGGRGRGKRIDGAIVVNQVHKRERILRAEIVVNVKNTLIIVNGFIG